MSLFDARKISKLLSFGVLTSLVSFVSSLWLASLYPVGDFGLYANLMASANLMSGFLFLRADMMVVNPLAGKVNMVGYAAHLLVLSTISALVVGFVLDCFLTRSAVWTVVWAFAFALMSLSTYMLISQNRQSTLGAYRVVSVVLLNLPQLILGLLRVPNGLIVGGVVGTTLSSILIFLNARRGARLGVPFQEMRHIFFAFLRPSALVTAYWILESAYLLFYPILIARCYGIEFAGYYSFADRLIKAPVAVLSGTLIPFIIGGISGGTLSAREIYTELLRFWKWMAAFSLVFVFASHVLLGNLVRAVWGEKWVVATKILPFVAVYYSSYLMFTTTAFLYQHYQSMRICIRFQILQAVAGICAIMFIRNPFWGIPTGLLAMALVNACSGLFQQRLTRSKMAGSCIAHS